MDANEIIASAERRIREHRTAEARLRFVDKSGQPLAGAKARVTLLRHEFKLGANAFPLGRVGDPGLQRVYEDRFAALLNYATVPFYWGHYEPERGRPIEEKLVRTAEWCRAKGITTKGHPLVWHEVFPQWAATLDDAEVIRLQEARVRKIVARFAGSIDIWDVVNEATVSHNFDNAIGRWIAREGASDCVARALRWGHEANPAATLLYNDFRVGPELEALLQAQLGRHAPFHAVGIQSHMHKGTWPLIKAWETCETYARFRLPLHFTELTVLSGRPKAEDDMDWHATRTDWTTTPDGEARQVDYVERFYTSLFSHPAVDGVTWWDLSDEQSWMGAPSGLLRKDMSPKPAYDRLMEMFHERWTTDATVTADKAGCASARCFFGEHVVEGRTASGESFNARFTMSRRGPRDVTIPV